MDRDTAAEPLVYSNATQEQVDEARERARAKFADGDEHWTEERRAEAHRAFLARLTAA